MPKAASDPQRRKTRNITMANDKPDLGREKMNEMKAMCSYEHNKWRMPVACIDLKLR